MFYVEYNQTSAKLYDEEQWKNHRKSPKQRQAQIDTDSAPVALSILTALQAEINRDFDNINWAELGGKIMDIQL